MYQRKGDVPQHEFMYVIAAVAVTTGIVVVDTPTLIETEKCTSLWRKAAPKKRSPPHPEPSNYCLPNIGTFRDTNSSFRC